MKTVDRTIDVIMTDIAKLQGQIRDINERMQELEQKVRQDKSVSISEREEYEHLEAMRRERLAKWGEVSAEHYGAEHARDGHDAALVPIDGSRLHIAQGHVGYTNFNKRCPHCKRFLILRRQNATNTLDSYFWACPSFFEPHGSHLRHTYTEPFRLRDASLFARLNIQDWQTRSDELERLAQLAQNPIKKRVSEHVGDTVDRTVCGVHGEPLALHQRNKSGLGLLEMYQLVCGRPHCEYRVNITTVGQLTALLAAAEGKGIL